MHRRLTLCLGLLLLVPSVCTSVADGHFTVPDRDLASAEFGETRVVFMPNGAAVVMNGREALMDLGLSFSAGGAWGLQIRDVYTAAPWRVGEEGRKISTEGNLLAFRKKPAYLKYEEKITLLPRGLLFRYKLTALRDLDLSQLGVSLRLPVAKMKGTSLRFVDALPADIDGIFPIMPESRPEAPRGDAAVAVASDAAGVLQGVDATPRATVVLPLSKGEASLGGFPGRLATLTRQGRPFVSFDTQAPSQWLLYDERAYNLNTFRLAMNPDPPVTALECGAQTEIKFAVHFHSVPPRQPTDDMPAAEAMPTATTNAIVVPLDDDTTTRGNWVGNYGTYAHVIAGMLGYSTQDAGPGWPFRFGIATGNPRISPAAWISPFDCGRDARALHNPTRSTYTAGSFDDHGEDYAPGKGPDLLLRVGVPAGLYRLSLYFLDIDWVQYRALGLEIRAGGKLVWQGLVEDFFNGVYKRFLITGPQDLQIRINKLDSANAVISGILVDKCIPPVPYPLAPSAANDSRSDFPLFKAAAQLQELDTNHHLNWADRMGDVSMIYASLCKTGQSDAASFRDSCVPLLPKLNAVIEGLLPGAASPQHRVRLLWMLASLQRAAGRFHESSDAVERLADTLEAIDASRRDNTAPPVALQLADALLAAGDHDFAGLVARKGLHNRLQQAQAGAQDEEARQVQRAVLAYAASVAAGKAYRQADALYSLAFDKGLAAPDGSDAHWLFAQSLHNARDYAQAVVEYGKVAEAGDSPHMADALYTSANLLSCLGRYDEAGASLARLVQEHPTFKPIEIQLARAENCYHLRDLTGANKLLAIAEKLAVDAGDDALLKVINSYHRAIDEAESRSSAGYISQRERGEQ